MVCSVHQAKGMCETKCSHSQKLSPDSLRGRPTATKHTWLCDERTSPTDGSTVWTIPRRKDNASEFFEWALIGTPQAYYAEATRGCRLMRTKILCDKSQMTNGFKITRTNRTGPWSLDKTHVCEEQCEFTHQRRAPECTWHLARKKTAQYGKKNT